MVKIYSVSICEDDVGEVEGMFDAKGVLLGWWSLNDANWRHEYFEGFMSELGLEVIEASNDRKLVSKLRRAAKQ